MLQKEAVEKTETHLLLSVTWESCLYMVMWKYMVEPDKAHAHCMLDNKGCIHTFRICNTFRFSAWTVVTPSTLRVDVCTYVGGLVIFFFQMFQLLLKSNIFLTRFTGEQSKFMLFVSKRHIVMQLFFYLVHVWECFQGISACPREFNACLCHSPVNWTCPIIHVGYEWLSMARIYIYMCVYLMVHAYS